jgi:hypothetical protein
VGFILACTGHRYRAVAGSNPALPTKQILKSNQEKPVSDYGRTHSALGLYGRFVVRFRLWYSHSLTRVKSQPLSWYSQPQGAFTVLSDWAPSFFVTVVPPFSYFKVGTVPKISWWKNMVRKWVFTQFVLGR